MSNEDKPAPGPDTPGPDPAAFARGDAAERPDHGGVPGDVADLTSAERELESDLSRLHPATKATGLEEMVRLAFRAGHAAAGAEVAGRNGRKLILWRAAAAVLVGGLGVSLLSRPTPQVVERERTKVVYVDRFIGQPAKATPVVASQGGSSNAPVGTGQTARAAEADAGAYGTLPEFLATADSPSRPLIPSADADYLSLRDAVLRLGVRVIPSPQSGAPAGGPVTLETLLGPSAPASPARPHRGGVGAGLDEVRKFLTGGHT
jgi:hypothetical protein